MKLHSIFTFFLLLSIEFIASKLEAQIQYGYIKGKVAEENAAGSYLPSAHITVMSKQGEFYGGTVSDENGEYYLQVPNGAYTIVCSYVGFAEKSQKIYVATGQCHTINWMLSYNLDVVDVFVTVEAEWNKTCAGVYPCYNCSSREWAKYNIPIIFGEKDILKTIQLLPGVSPTAEANANYYVRGGTADQNLVLLDEMTIYKPAHLLGFLGVFNNDVVGDAALIRGNSPVQFGGRLASVLAVEMEQGHKESTIIKGGLGLLGSRISLSTPIQKGKSSLMIAARRSNSDFLIKSISRFKNYKFFFYDLNLKATYELNSRNMLFLSGYMGADFVSFPQRMETKGGNIAGNLRWRSIINKKIFANTSLIFSSYEQKTNLTNDNAIFTSNAGLRDLSVKEELQYFANDKSNWRFGVNATHRRIRSIRSTDNNTLDKFGLENVAYVGNQYAISKQLTMVSGLRLSAYSVLDKTYLNLEPRFAIGYQINGIHGLKITYDRNTQHLHRLSNHILTSPTDQWVGNSYLIKPEIADQVSAGYYTNLGYKTFQLNAEVYYKNMQNQIDYKNGADINTAPDLESQLLFGKGRAYGLELYLKKQNGKFTGWIAYALAWSERQIMGVNNNNWYASCQDRRHDISVVTTYQLSKKWSISAVFECYTGNPIYYQTGENRDRMPTHHRLDLGATYKSDRKDKYAERKRFQNSWDFVLYNAYGSRNVYDLGANLSNAARPTSASLFRWLPSVTYNFSF